MDVGKGLVVSRTNALGIHMSATEWQIVKEIFYKALSFDAEARDQYLDDACRDNVELRAEVESLLGSMGKAESFLEKPAAADATTIVSDSHLKTGQQISHYKIVSHLASGGMGEVYLAEDQSLPRKVALKILPEQAFPDSDQVRRFKSEANAISALNHPNILTIFEFDSEDGIHLLVSEYVEGETLRERIRRGRLPVAEAVEMSVQIVSALNAAHGAGIIHRDVKPENIMIRADGYVKVLDFGLAKLTDIERPDENAVTLLQAVSRTGMIMGTAKYMSPEQARAKQIDSRTDIFSFGIVLYEMLTGQPPFSGDSTADVIVSILQYDPPSVRSMNAETPSELNAVVKKALSKDPAERYQTAGELLSELKTILRKIEVDTALGQSGQGPITSTGPIQENSGDTSVEDRDALIGRDSEIEDVTGLLRRNDIRLVTLTGIGGTGKTRLARAVADRLSGEFAAGSAFVELSCVRDPNLVISAVAQSLGIPEIGGTDVCETLRNELSDKPALLILDNLEQVIAAATEIAELLEDLPGSKVLATSRELLHLSMEVEYAVPPLGFPSISDAPTVEELYRYESVVLFERRARRANPDFAVTEENGSAVAEICARLDGLPLAIELAAARTKILSPEEILAKLDDRLSLLTGGAKDLPDRQRTVRGAIEWSYDLLSDDEKDVFRRLSVFAGGFTPSSAEAVLVGSGISVPTEERRKDERSWSGDQSIFILDMITSLTDKSLLVPQTGLGGTRRFRMLDTVREYAAAVLAETGTADEVHLSHAEFFLELAETAKPHLKLTESGKWLRRLENEHDNIRAALRWTLNNAPEIAARLAAAIRHLWTIHGHLHEGRSWSAEILSRNIDMSDAIRWEVLTVYGNLSQFQGDVEKAEVLYEESLTVSTRSADKLQISQSLRGLAALAYMRDDFDLAKSLIERSIELSRAANDEFGLAASFARLADVANAEDDFRAARDLSAKALAIYRKLDYKEGISAKLNNLGAAVFALGDYEEARKCFDEALATAIELGEKINTRLIFDGYGALAAENGDFELSAKFSGFAETLGASIGYAPEPAELRFRDSYLEKVRAELCEDEYNAAYREGLKLNLEEATNLAHDRI